MRQFAPGISEALKRELGEAMDEMKALALDPKAPKHSPEFQEQMRGEAPPEGWEPKN